jgi:acyl carrier protein
VQPDQILSLMKSFFEGKQPPEILEGFAEQKPVTLLKESLDVVDFVVYLEEELGREIDMQQVGAALASLTFGELAEQVSAMLEG